MYEGDKAMPGGEPLGGGTETGTDAVGTGTEVPEAGTDEGKDGTEAGTGMAVSLDQAEVVGSIEALRDDLLQATALLEANNALMAALVFLTLFTWAERKVKDTVMKFTGTGGTRNA